MSVIAIVLLIFCAQSSLPLSPPLTNRVQSISGSVSFSRVRKQNAPWSDSYTPRLYLVTLGIMLLLYTLHSITPSSLLCLSTPHLSPASP
ncbi:hypothetical protein LZ31DRAFT_558493 [Colletotrichum somersetense]|nr:hypothetical protein LZ31DRAFT_558493 [Colletotrichum somersetense]